MTLEISLASYLRMLVFCVFEQRVNFVSMSQTTNSSRVLVSSAELGAFVVEKDKIKMIKLGKTPPAKLQNKSVLILDADSFLFRDSIKMIILHFNAFFSLYWPNPK